MTEKDFVNHQIKRNKDHFVSQYGNKTLERLERETLTQPTTLFFYYSLQNKFFPEAKAIFETATKIDFINSETWFFKKTAEEYEKKLDYLHIGAVIILENWLNNLLPQQFENPVKMFPENNMVSGWLWGKVCMIKFSEMYDELEKKFKL
jgi:hypothetical protein